MFSHFLRHFLRVIRRRLIISFSSVRVALSIRRAIRSSVGEHLFLMTFDSRFLILPIGTRSVPLRDRFVSPRSFPFLREGFSEGGRVHNRSAHSYASKSQGLLFQMHDSRSLYTRNRARRFRDVRDSRSNIRVLLSALSLCIKRTKLPSRRADRASPRVVPRAGKEGGDNFNPMSPFFTTIP